MLALATQLIFLGVGTPVPYPDRSGPAVAVVYGDQSYIFDAGPGVVRRANEMAMKRGVSALAATRLTRLFLTHLHTDHTLGLPDIMFTPWPVGRTDALEVWGPKGTKDMVDHIRSAWSLDLDMRLSGLEHGNETGHQTVVHEIEAGFVYRDGDVEIRAVPVHHGSWKQAFAYRIKTPDKVIVISGDCAPSEEIVKACNGCDILVHEVYEETGLQPGPWLEYMHDFHTSSTELAALASKAKPKTLLIYHLLFVTRSIHEQEILDEIKRGYRGRTLAAHDLDVF